jgi:serine protease Do
MKKVFNSSRLIITLLAVAFIAGPSLQRAEAVSNPTVQMAPLNFSELADRVGPAVVHIKVEKIVKNRGPATGPFGPGPFGGNDPFRDFFGRRFDQPQPDLKRPGQGSGFIVDQAGFIVTNNHVVDGADSIEVTLKDESRHKAEIVGRDPITDIAVIKIEAKKSLPTVRLGNSDSLRVGEWVAAIGSPFGLEYTVTAGIVSAKGRVIGSGPYDDFIQTDASINPGNSGGPLINMKGEVIGINTMIIAAGQGIGFAIPVDQAKGIIAQLRSDGKVTRGWLGVTIQDLKDDLAEYYGVAGKSGVLVAEVVPGDPADKAGIKPKDIITEVNGRNVTSSRELTNLAAKLNVGDEASVTVLRDGQQKVLKVRIGKRPVTIASVRPERGRQEKGEFGFEVTELTPEIARKYNIQGNSGVVVVGVAPDSKADMAGIQTGDLIIEINRVSVGSIKDFRGLINRHKGGNGIRLLIKRMNSVLLVVRLV